MQHSCRSGLCDDRLDLDSEALIFLSPRRLRVRTLPRPLPMYALSHPMGTPPPDTHRHSLIVRLGYIKIGVNGASCSSLTSGDPTHPLDHSRCVTALKVRPSDAKWGKASDMRMCMTGMSILRRMLFRSLHPVHVLTCSVSLDYRKIQSAR